MEPIIKQEEEYVIHSNIPVLARAKGIELVDYKILNHSEFKNKAISNGLFDYHGKNKLGENVYIAFITLFSAYLKKEGMNKIVNNHKANKYIIILPTKKIVKIDDVTKNVEFINGSLSMISDFEMFKEKLGLSVRVLDEEETQHYMNLYKIPHKSCLPKIGTDSNEIIYSTGIPGDVVELVYPSYSTGALSGSLNLIIKSVPIKKK